MDLQIVSDIHLEFSSDFYPKKTAKYIALLGDIGYPDTHVYQKFIQKLSKDYLRVFIVAGNHEFYGHDYILITNILKEIDKKYVNVHFLNNSSYVLNGIRLIGGTLWSQIPHDFGFSIMANINDYRQIRCDNKQISYMDTNQWHQESLEFIQEELYKALQQGQKVVVLTHHSPILDPTNTSKIKNAFATDLKHLFQPPMVMWGYGHTHRSSSETINGVRVVSNQRGYPGENTGFDPGLYVSIPE